MKKIGILLSLFILSCASQPKYATNQFQLKKYQEVKMENGLRLLLLEDSSLPRVSLLMMIQVGSFHNPQGQEGLNSMTVSLLDAGTTTRSAMKLADEFGQLGTEIDTSSSADYSMVSVSGLSTTKETLLDLFADVILNPAFAPQEIERTRSQALAALAKTIDQPSGYTEQLFDLELFGNHPYAYPNLGTADAVKKISRSDIMRHYFKYFRPNNSILAVTGKFDADFVEKIKKAFSGWQAKEVEQPMVQLREDKDGYVKLVSKKDLQQAQIRIGQLGIKRTDPDFMNLRIANLALGGAFGSRLNQKVRDDLGLTYSISSSSSPLYDRGSLEISTFTRNDKVYETISETQKVVQDFVKEGITPSELSATKSLMIGQFPGAIETVDKLAINLLVLRRYGISDDYLHHFMKNVDAVTVKDVNRAIQKHYRPEQMKVLIYADETQVLDRLKPLGEIKIEKK